ncbi:sensor domain-containing diguanylate cyclase [Bacillus sp. 31A1R]|uniref:Sensor domain-containing diguanylate cyclase n=1 Tax=Robertmurraya mangrovi TaxID=3098077 RepID=A0ABU5J3P8_9BACI|nr:sensor domain-containing diguanylate cyclase [Bacillus sp. 31A1R]MDZ5473996.1 sensor domain-containing diguanylate cyclase [Bacillus sp. 31A1R]
MYVLFLFLSIVLALSINLIRFHFNPITNKIIFTFSSLFLVEVYATFIDVSPLTWMLLIFIFSSSYAFQIWGGIGSASISYAFLHLQIGEELLVLPLYLLFGVVIGFAVKYINKQKEENDQWNKVLLKQSKYFHVFSEVSVRMQQTLQRDKLLTTILTSVTAGHGLGFNRAMIFLHNEETNTLTGILGVGPMDIESGYNVWEAISAEKLKLKDLITYNFQHNLTDPELNSILKTIEIPFDKNNIFGQALLTHQPILVDRINEKDEIQVFFKNIFNTKEFAVIPLITQGKNIGILFIDNIVNQKPITLLELEYVIPLANQAAIAINHTSLYNQIEEMALKDGLTGLHNQRAFQSIFEQYFQSISITNPLSLIIFDIDYFKVYNDKNGHLLGNEVLMQLAKVFHQSIRTGDYSFRFGGEEFVALLPNTTLEEAYLIGETIRKNVEQTVFPGEEKQPTGTLTISLGIASTESLMIQSKNDLIDAADRALYKAKETGKNKVVLLKEYVPHE